MEASASDNKFQSPTFGILEVPQVIDRIVEYVENQPDYPYRVIVGSDSQQRNSHGTDFVTAVIVHRVGGGGIYFWQRETDKKPFVLKQRIFEEALRSLICAQKFLEAFGKENGLMKNLEIHVDVGQKGPTREIINEVVGMIRGNGFAVKIKPDAFGASKVADRHT